MRKLSAVAFALLALNAFAAGRELAPRGAAPTSYLVTQPLVAFAGEHFLTVWTEDMGDVGMHLMGAFSDASGRRITPLAFPVARSFVGRPLQLVGTGDAYALFWKDSLGITHLTDIDLAGRVTRATELALPQQIDLRVAWNGARFFAMLRHPAGITYDSEGFLLSRSGAVLRRNIPIDDQAYAYDVAANGDGFVGATSGFLGLFAYRITGEGDVTAFAIDARRAGVPRVSTTADGGLLVVYSAENELYAGTVSTSTEFGRRVLVTSPQPMHVVHTRRAGDAHLVTYLDMAPGQSGIRTLRLAGDGTITPASGRAFDFPPNVFMLIVAESSAQATLTVFRQPDIQFAPLLSVAIANDRSAGAPEVLSISRARQSQPILGANGGRTLAAWSDIQGYAAYVRTSSLTPDATPLTDTIAAPAYVAARELPWNGSEYLIVQSRGDQLLATRVAVDGTPLGEPLLLGQHHSPWWRMSAAVAWVGDRWVVAWETSGGIFFATVRDGAVTPARKLNLGDVYATDPALAFNGSTLLFAWNEVIPPECWFPPCPEGETLGYAARLTPDGELADEKRVALPVAGEYSIVTSGSEFFILGGTNATTLDAGTLRIRESRRIFNWPAAGDVTWNGSTYAVALRYRGVRWHLSVTHFDRELNVVGAPRGIETLPPDQFVAPSIAGSIVAVQEGDAEQGARAVVYRESDLQALPAPPPAPVNVRATPLDDGRFRITWDPSPGAELYLVTVWNPAGFVWHTVIVPADQLYAFAHSASVRVTAFNAGGGSEPLPRRRGVRR